MRATLCNLLLAGAISAAATFAAPVTYYVGVDGLATLTTGPYAGLSNPNYGRLTFLLNHGDHFHGVGTYSYSGDPASPDVEPTSGNNRVPEISSGEGPLALAPGSGLYSGKLVNQITPSEYSSIHWNSIDQLMGFEAGTEEDVLLNSSAGRWKNSILDSVLALELVWASPGLRVGSAGTLDLFASGPFTIGEGAGFEFQPVFWIDQNSPTGTYSATFRLHDVSASGERLPSGEFTFDFAAAAPVPEPSTFCMLGGALLTALAAGRCKAPSRRER